MSEMQMMVMLGMPIFSPIEMPSAIWALEISELLQYWIPVSTMRLVSHILKQHMDSETTYR